MTDQHTIHIDGDLQKQADTLFAKLGITTEEAVRLFLHQALLHRGLPFDVQLPAAFAEENDCSTERPDKSGECHTAAAEPAPALPAGVVTAHEESRAGYFSGSGAFCDWGTFNDDDEEIGCQG